MAKNILLLSIFLCCCVPVLKAQDTLVMNDGSQAFVKVMEVGETTISYKKRENIQGPTYTIDLSKVFMAFYKGGKRESFSVKASATGDQAVAENATSNAATTPGEVLRNDTYELVFSSYSSDYANKKKKKGTVVNGAIKVLKKGNYYMEIGFSANTSDLSKDGYIFFIPKEEKYQKYLDTKYENSSGIGQWILPAGFFAAVSLDNYYVNHYIHKSLFGQDFASSYKGKDAHKYELQDASTISTRILSVGLLWLQQNFK